MMEWMLMPLKRYAEFDGRSQRKEYWMFTLFNIIVMLGLIIVGALIGGFEPGSSGELGGGSIVMFSLIGIYALAIFIPALAVQVRRFHDQDKSGWFVLIGFIPYIGGLIVFVFMCLDGTKGENRFGADPKMNQNVSDVFS